MYNKVIINVIGLLLLATGFSDVSHAQALKKSSAPIHITADTLEVDQTGKTATFSGNVEALQENVTLKAEKMVVFYNNAGNQAAESSNDISKIEVVGGVTLSRPGESAKGDKGVYDVTKSTILLSGNVILKKDSNTVKGTHLVYNLETGKSEISGGKKQNGASGGRVTGVFVPQKD